MTAVTVSVLVAGCGGGDQTPDDVPTVTPATAAASPNGTAAPAGTVAPAPGGSRVAVAGSTVAAVIGDGVRLSAVGSPTESRTIGTGPLAALVPDRDGFLGVGPNGLVHVSATGEVANTPVKVDGPLSLALDGDRVLIGTSHGHLLVVERDGRIAKDIAAFVRVDAITVAPQTAAHPGQVVVLDRAQSLVAPVDLADGSRLAALRAGNGATEALVDRFGRIVVSGTRDDQLMGFFGEPLVMRFRYPVTQSPYALAFDERRDLLWVATTGDNQAIAFDLTSGEPIEQNRIPTVGQVASMAVDSRDGTLYLLSGRGDGLQVVSPEASNAR